MNTIYMCESAKEREQVIVSICGRIWARYIKEKGASAQTVPSNNA